MRAMCLLLLAAASAAAQSYSVQAFAGTDFAGDGGPGTSATLQQVFGLAIDLAGNLYISDADDHRIRRVGPDGIIHTVAGMGRPGFSGDGGRATEAALKTPYGIALDPSGALYIADLGNRRIRRIATDGTITTIAGGGDKAPAGGIAATSAAFDSPRNVAVDASGNVYLSDFGANRVWQVTPAGMLVAIAGTGTAGFSGDRGPAVQAQLNAPAGLALDRSGGLYIADSGNGRVRRVFRSMINSEPLDLLMPTGLAFDLAQNLYIADPSGNQTVKMSTVFLTTPMKQLAHDVASDLAGNLYLAEGSFVRRLTTAGITEWVAGSVPASPLGQDVRAIRLADPRGIARDAGGTVYVADTAHDRVLKIGPDGTVSGIIGTGTRGYGGDGLKPETALLNSPQAVVVQGDALYIADTGNHRIRTVVQGVIATVAGTGEAGYSGDGGDATAAQLRSPTALALDATGSLLICDTGNHRVRRILNSGEIETVAGTALPGYEGDGGAAREAALDTPQGIAADSTGTIYISDAGNHRIRRIQTAGAAEPAIDSLPADPIWRDPRGLAVATDGALIVSDAADQRVFRVEPSSGRIAAIAGTGEAGLSGDGGPALESKWNGPAGIAVDNSGTTIFVADSANNRIRILSLTDPGNQTPAKIKVVNAASFLEGPVAPGEIVSLMATGLFAGARDVKVLVDDRSVPVFATTADQINTQIPPSANQSGSATVSVVAQGSTIGTAVVALTQSAPGIFQAPGGQVAALNEDQTYNSRDNPSPRGSILVFYATGDGGTNPAQPDGVPATFPPPPNRWPVSVHMGGYEAKVHYAGPAPGFMGLMQINAEVPAGFAPTGCISLELKVGNATSQQGVFACTR